MLNGNITVEEVTLNREKFTIIKKVVVVKSEEKTLQISVGGHHHSEEKLARLASMLKE